MAGAYKCCNEPSGSMNREKFFSLGFSSFSEMFLLHGVI